MSATRVTIGESPAPEPVRLVIGQMVGRYRVDAILGTGGMGTVARARDLDLDRDVALKVAVFSDAADARSRAERLLREAQAMAKLRAPNVRAVHDVGTAGGLDYVAMEYIAGTDLAGWLATPRSLRAIAGVFAAAGDGLAAAHAAGILHRDVKPSNILVGDDGSVVVTDFGLARWMHEPARAGGGTPGYIAPDAEPDVTSDQYSFCVALGEAVPAASPLRAIAARGSSASPGDRYPSMEAVVAAIRRAVRPPRRWPIVVAAAVVVAAIAAVLVWPRATPDTFDDPAIAHVRELMDRGFLTTARADADKLVATAPEMLRPAATCELGWVALYQNDTAAARTALSDASRLADAAKDDRTRARADIGLFMLATARGSDLAAIKRAEDTAVASSSRVDLDRVWRAELLYMQANATLARGDQATGRRQLAEAREMVTPPDVAALVAWAEIVRTQARFAPVSEHVAMFRELVTTVDEVGGASHMEAISGRGELAMAYEDAGLLDDAARTMAEMRAAGATADGSRLLAEIDATPQPPMHALVVTVRDGGAPVAGATVVAATELRGNARYLVGSLPLYAEHERHLVTATTDAAGMATVRVPDSGTMWVGAEDREHGRAIPIRVEPQARTAELAVARWGLLTGDATGVVQVVSESEPLGPELVVETDPHGHFTVGRIAVGRYIITACSRPPAQTCRAIRMTVGVKNRALDLRLPAGNELLVRVRDELQRPIESSVVVILPRMYQPTSFTAFQHDWRTELAASPADAVVAWGSGHDARPIKLSHIPEGYHQLCAAAFHGDTEDPAFTAKLDTLPAPVPIFCENIYFLPGNDITLVVPAASRVWLP